MSKKHKIKQTPIQKLDERLQELNKKRLQAYQAGMSYQILEQIDRMIEEVQLELYTETELFKYRSNKDDEDGESFIV